MGDIQPSQEVVTFLNEHGIDSLEKVQMLLGPNLYAIIPISILESKELTANAKLLYAEVMALSKKSGRCFATNEYLATRLGLSPRTIPALLQELNGCGILHSDVKRNSKGTYRNITVSFFGDEGHRSFARGGIAIPRGQKRNRQREIEKERDSVKTPPPPFVLQEEIRSLKISPQRHIQLIGEYLEESGFHAQTKKAFEVGWRRHLKDAVSLSAFEDTQIGRATDYANKEYKKIGWNLGTLVKIITSNLYAKR